MPDVEVKYRVDIEKAIDDYSDMVYRIAITRVRKKEIAEDVYQEVFLRLNRSIEKIESEDHLKNWLIKVTINCTKDELMSKWNYMDEIPDNYSDISSTDSGFKSNDAEMVFNEVQKLEEKYRTVIYLFYYEDMKISDIAKLLETNESTVKTRLMRAKNILKERIQIVEGGDM